MNISTSVLELNKKEKIWNLDMVICGLTIFISPILFFYTFVSQYIFQDKVNLIYVLQGICVLRLVVVFLSNPRNLGGVFRIKYILASYSPIFYLALYSTLLGVYQSSILIDYFNINTTDLFDFVFTRGTKYISFFLISIYYALVLDCRKKIAAILNVFIYALVLAEVMGIVQLVVFQTTGFDILPITRVGGADNFLNISATVNFMGINCLRINSLSHEPKGLAALMNLLFVLKFYWSEYSKRYDFKRERIYDLYMRNTAWLSVFVILATFSGGGFFTFVFSLILIFIFNRKYSQATKLSLLGFFFVIFVVLQATPLNSYFQAFSDSAISRRGDGISQAIQGDFSNLDSIGDPEDAGFTYIFLEYPYVLISGLGHGTFSSLSSEYVGSLYKFSQGASSFSRNLFIETVCSVGIFGIITVFVFFKNICLRYITLKNYIYYSQDYYLHLFICIQVIQMFFIRSIEFLFFVLIGIAASIHFLRQNQPNEQLNSYSP